MRAPNCTIPATDGEMDAYLSLPDGRPKATVLMQVELWGLTAHMGEVADRLAAQGYAAVVCDLFRGATPPVPSDPLETWGETFKNFDDVRATRDCRHALDWALSSPDGHDFGRVFAWGFCMGGRFAHNLAAFDTRLAGAINFYGRINFPRMSNKPFLPIEITRMIASPYLGVFAETDGLIPTEDVERLRADLEDNPGAEISVYPGTEHAFFNDHRDAYHADAASQAWAKVLAFLERHS
ncbi:MAG: dienelactone hydrolase family protein [Pseudomonadota bacterium]